VPPERDEGRRFDAPKLSLHVVGNYGVRLLHETLERLGGSAPHEVNQRLYVIRNERATERPCGSPSFPMIMLTIHKLSAGSSAKPKLRRL